MKDSMRVPFEIMIGYNEMKQLGMSPILYGGEESFSFSMEDE
jgi:hypothetical protein